MSHKRQIFKLNILKNLLTEENSCVSLVQVTRLLALPPFFLNDMKSGILYQLSTMLKKYDRSLGGIVIGYQNIKVLMDENTGIIPMGTSETEVNISVEFYIFQPKIGSFLEGVINKKSNTHIGCLVHQYFNATILKPEDVLYEDWICKNFNVDDRIIFKVKDLDFTTLLPYIEGDYDGAQLLKVKTSENCDSVDKTSTDVNKSCQNEILLSREINDNSKICNETNKHLLSDKKDVINNEVLAANNNNVEDHDSFGDGKVKKKKKKKDKDHILLTNEDHTKESKEGKCSDPKELTSDGNKEELQAEEIKVKKKKKKKADADKDSHENPNPIKKSDTHTVFPSSINTKLLEIEDEDSNDFVKTSKRKKVKNKNENEKPVPKSNRESECLPPQETEDNVFYSTQLEPLSDPQKMRIPFCSPIPRGSSFEKQWDIKNTTPENSGRVNSQDNSEQPEKDVKKKHKKRKKEKKDEPDGSPPVKKPKMSNDSTSKQEEPKKELNGSGGNSLLQAMMAQLCQQQLNRVKEELNMSSSDKESFKEEKKHKKEAKKSKIEIKHPEETKKIDNKKSQVNGDEMSSEVQNILEKLMKEQLERVKEELSTSDRESYKESKKTKMKKQKKHNSEVRTEEEVKETKNAQSNSTNENKTKSEEQSTVDKILRLEINRVKEELTKSDTDNVKEKKKKKKKKSLSTNKQENAEEEKEKMQNSLYNRLLSEARNAIDVEKDTPAILPTTEFGKKKKDPEISNSSKSHPKKNDSKKTKQKLDDYQQTPDKYKNGSMYDILPTPEGINPDKSLFSDSEQSHVSPNKKTKVINGESKKSAVQNLLDEFYKEETKRLKTESDKDSLKSSEKKSKKKSKTEEPEKEESLYEKLLKEAKSFIDDREISSGKKEKKRKKKHKKDSVKT